MELIQELNEQGIKIQLIDSEHLALTPKNRVSPELIEKVRANKQELLHALRGTQDKGGRENVEPGRDLTTITVFSKVLRREVFISWEGDNPETVFLDGVPYSLEEIGKLKEAPLSVDDLKLIHETKRAFDGRMD
jgi:hypothetical protein